MNKILLNKIHFILLVCMPFLIVTGPLLPELVIIFNSFLMIYYLYKKKILLNKLNYIVLFILLYLLILSFFSVNVTLSLEASLFYFRFFLLIIGLNYAINNYRDFEKYITLIFIILLFFLFFDSIIQYFYRYNFFLFKAIDNRISSFFGDELVMGGFLSRLYPLIICITIYELFKSDKILIVKYKSFMILLLILIFSILIILSGERSAIVTFFVSNFILFLFLPLKRLFIFFFISLSLIIISLYIFDVSLFNRIFLNTYIALFQSSIFMPDHWAIFSTAFEIIKDNFILGIGPKLFREFCLYDIYYVAGGCSTSPHNYYIQALLETGIIGLACLCSFLFFVIYNIIKFSISLQLSNINIKKFGYNISVLTCIFPFIPTGNFFGNWISIMIFFNIGFVLQLILKGKDE